MQSIYEKPLQKITAKHEKRFYSPQFSEGENKMGIIQHYIQIHSVYRYANRFSFVDGFNKAVNIAVTNRIKSEVIGGWLYCFTTQLIGVQLQAIGFWYSYKHNAYVYTGRKKDGLAFIETLDEIRARLGSKKL